MEGSEEPSNGGWGRGLWATLSLQSAVQLVLELLLMSRAVLFLGDVLTVTLGCCWHLAGGGLGCSTPSHTGDTTSQPDGLPAQGPARASVRAADLWRLLRPSARVAPERGSPGCLGQDAKPLCLSH